MSAIATLVLALLSWSGHRLVWHIDRFPWEIAGQRMLRLL